MVGFIFFFLHLLCCFWGEIRQGGDALVQRPDGGGSHVGGNLPAALQGNGGGSQQTLIQLAGDLGLLAVGHQFAHQSFQPLRKGQHQQGTQQIEQGMGNRDAHEAGAFLEQCRGENGFHQAEHRQPHGGANHIEAQVNHSGALCIFIGTNAGNQGGDTGADVLPHDDGNCRAICYLAGGGQRLQDTHGGGAGLDNGGESSTGQHTQHGVLEQQEQLLEAGNIPQTGDGGGHTLHAVHQGSEAQKNQAGILRLVVLAEHQLDGANQRQNGGEGGGLEQLDKQIAAGNARQT